MTQTNGQISGAKLKLGSIPQADWGEENASFLANSNRLGGRKKIARNGKHTLRNVGVDAGVQRRRGGRCGRAEEDGKIKTLNVEEIKIETLTVQK